MEQIPIHTASKPWSPQQLAVCDAVANGEGHLVVRARAGSGKTTTIIEAVRRIPLTKRVLLCAFNKSIKNELEKRAPKHVNVKTLHGLGFAAMMRQWPNVVLDARRGRRLLEKALGRRPTSDLVALLSLCKARMTTDLHEIECGVQSGARIPGMKDSDVARAILAAMAAACERDGTIDFDDQVFVPAASDLRAGHFDVVIVDETQDMNAAQLKLAQSALAPSGRLIAVGDDRQAIYAWRGADVGFMDRMQRELSAALLPLSVTYRCPTSAVALASRLVPDIETAPGAAAGEIRSTSTEEAGWREGDAVLSRINAPLVRHALAALRSGIRARIQGRDIGAGLKGLVESFGCVSSQDLVRRTRDWANAERERLGHDDENEAILADIADKASTIEALTEGCRTVFEVTARLDLLFRDDGPGLVFSSVHRAKGLEWNRVFLLSWTFKPERSEEEENIAYVALTRTKRELVFVTSTAPAEKVTSPMVSSWLRAAAETAAA
jgi:DNA helicase-2/ATP-dependent DNA helicase PcrA